MSEALSQWKAFRRSAETKSPHKMNLYRCKLLSKGIGVLPDDVLHEKVDAKVDEVRQEYILVINIFV